MPKGKAARRCLALRGASFHDAPRNSASPNSEMRRWRRIVDASLWNPIIFIRAEGVGSNLYRLPNPCHAESLIHAWGFCAEHARNSLRRSPCPACRAEFFLYEKMGRRAIGHAGSISEEGPHPPKKIYGNPRGFNPLGERRAGSKPAALTLGQSSRGLALSRLRSEIFFRRND